MRLGRGGTTKSKPVALPERSQTVTLVPARGQTIPARVLESSPELLLVAILVPVAPLSHHQLEGMTLQFVAPHGRVRLTGTVSIEDPDDPDVLRFETPRSIEVVQEREYVRIMSSRPVLVYGGPDKIPVQSFTVDLSGGGLLLAGPDSLKIGDEVEFQLTLTAGVLTIGGKGRVVRIDDHRRRAVEFTSISELDRRRLIRFIFECQRDERQRGLDTGR
ncbi:MAG: PilZ domain-containing protein [Solirubrobacteraceae bacterium]